MPHGDPHEKDGGVSFYPADSARLQSYVEAERQLSQFRAPIFIHANNPHERLYVACLDGTGNDETKPRFGLETNVARISDQINALDSGRIHAGYEPGPGTQDGWLDRTRDGITGATYDEHLEDAYKKFIDQAKKWRNVDPQAEIRAVGVGFSRGGSEEGGLARLIQERGIQNPDGAIYTKNHDGRITSVEYTKPPLVAPGQVAQAELLFDPVSTGAPEKHDRRPPPSVVSGLQIIAGDERRSSFKSDHIIDPGMTPDGRFLGVTVAGAHSDIGGSYRRDGLGARSDNLAIDYLNSLSDTPFLARQVVPGDPSMSVVHRSEEAFPFDLQGKVDRHTPKGYNERLVPQDTHYVSVNTVHGVTRVPVHTERAGVSDPFNAELRDKTLDNSLDHHQERNGAATTTQEAPAPIAKNSSIHDMFEAINAAVANKDPNVIRDVSHAYLQSDGGQAWLTQGHQMNQQFQAQAQQSALDAQQQAAAQQAMQQQSQGFGR